MKHLLIGVFVFVSGATLLAGCRGEQLTQPDMASGDVSLPPGTTPATAIDPTGALGVPQPIAFDTYDKSNEVVHPSVVAFPSPWNGQRYWLAITPYPNSNEQFENPSVYGGVNGATFGVPAGLTNPIEQTKRGYLSDPELVYDSTANELRLYYREVRESGPKDRPHHIGDVVYLTRSTDGTHWSPARPVFGTLGRYVVSPAVSEQPTGGWRMWAIDAGRRGCTARDTKLVERQSADGVHWSKTKALSFDLPGYVPWHLDVRYVPQQKAYWALVAAYPRRTACTFTSLFLATSADGTNWTTYPTPVLARGTLPEFATNVYRSTFAFDSTGTALTIWLTGASTTRRGGRSVPRVLRWSAAIWHVPAAALLAHVRTPATTRLAMAHEREVMASLAPLAAANALP